MTIATDSKLARAFRIVRRDVARPPFRAQGYVAPAYGETKAPKLTSDQIKSRKSRHPGDGIGHAVHALGIARGMNEAPAPIYGGLPGKRYPEQGDGLRFVARVVPDVPCHGWQDSRGDTGWYTDPYGDVSRDGSGLCYGVIYQLPGKDGQARFIAGYQFGGVDGGPTLDFSQIHTIEARYYECSADAARDAGAAHAADSMAEIAAEKEREYQTAWQAGSQWAGELETVQEARKEALAILAERRAARGVGNFPALCAAIRGQVETLRETIRNARKRMAKLAAGDCESLYFWTGDETLQGAFCEGAGLDAMPGAGV